MKAPQFKTDAGILAGALRILKPVIERRNTIPVLSTVQFDGNLIRATDLDIEIEIAVSCGTHGFTGCIDHKALSSVVRELPTGAKVEIGSTSAQYLASLKFEGAEYGLASLPNDDFPTMKPDDLQYVDVDGESLKRALQFAVPFICNEATRYYLQGVCLDGGLAVATSGHILGRIPFKGSISGHPIIPRKAAEMLARLPAPTGVRQSVGYMQFFMPGAKLTTRLIDGKFPEWQRVVPCDHPAINSVSVKPHKLLPALRRAIALSWRVLPSVTLAWGDGRAVIVEKNPEFSMSEEVECAGKAIGSGCTAFNPKLLAPILRQFRNCEFVNLMQHKPGELIAITGGDDRYAILMPQRGALDETAKKALARLVAEDARRAV